MNRALTGRVFGQGRRDYRQRQSSAARLRKHSRMEHKLSWTAGLDVCTPSPAVGF